MTRRTYLKKLKDLWFAQGVLDDEQPITLSALLSSAADLGILGAAGAHAKASTFTADIDPNTGHPFERR